MLTIVYLMLATVTESMQLSAQFEKQVVRNDVNNITAKFLVCSSKIVGDRFLVFKFKILR